MLKILGRDNSVNVIKVLWAADEVGREFHREDVGGSFGGNDTPAFLQRNPMGTVPLVDDDGVVLWESNVIVRYLAARYGAGTLWPESVAERAVADNWMDWQQTALHPHITTVFRSLVRTPPEQRDATAVAAAAARCVELFAMLDRHLGERPYIAGERFTMGDIPVGAAAFRFVSLVPERPPMPNFDAWYMRLHDRKPYREHAMKPLT